MFDSVLEPSEGFMNEQYTHFITIVKYEKFCIPNHNPKISGLWLWMQIIIFMLQMEKLNHRGIKELAQASSGFQPRSLALESALKLFV